MRRGTRLRRVRGSRGRTGLLSTIGPVAVGVLLAFAWNMAVSQQQEISAASTAVTPEVGVTVEQAAAQAWASSTPDTASAGAPHAARGTWSAGNPRAAASGGCSRVTPRPVIVTWSPVPGHPAAAGDPLGRPGLVRATAICRPRPRFAKATEMDSTVSASMRTGAARGQVRPGAVNRKGVARDHGATRMQPVN